MEVIKIGPFALSTGVLLAALAIGASLGVAAWLRRSRGVDVEPLLWKVLIGGLLAARAAFVAAHFDIYAGAPLDVLDIRDAGFNATAGLFVACVIGAELTRKAQALRKPLLGAAMAGVLVWSAGVLAMFAFNPASTAVPDVALTRLDGSQVQLKALAGKPMVVNLWATWCPPCRREMPVLRDAQAKYPEVAFVFVNQGEDAETVGKYLAGERLKLANMLIDRGRELGRKTSSSAFPTTLFYHRDGMLVSRRVGELSAATLEERVKALRDKP